MDGQQDGVEEIKVADREGYLLGEFRLKQVAPAARDRQIATDIMVNHKYCGHRCNDGVVALGVADIKISKVLVHGSPTDIFKHALIFKSSYRFLIKESFKAGRDKNIREFVCILNAANIVGYPVCAYRGGFEFVADTLAGGGSKVFDEGVEVLQ